MLLYPGAFESDVVPDSGKTNEFHQSRLPSFESDVVPDSGKTSPWNTGLR